MKTKLYARESVAFDEVITVRDSAGDAVDITGWTFAAELTRQAGTTDVELTTVAAGSQGFTVADGPAGALRVRIDQATLAGIGDTTGNFTLFGDLLGTPPAGEARLVADLRMQVTVAGEEFRGATYSVVLEAVAAAVKAELEAVRDEAEAAQFAAELARDQAADLVLPENTFVDTTVAAATTAGEAAVVAGVTFKAVGTSEGYAQVRLRTAGGSDLLYEEVTKAALSSAASGKGVALVGFRQLGSGAVDRTAGDKLLEAISAKDFGAVIDGVTDDTAAYQALAEYHASVGGPVDLGRGRAIINEAIEFIGSGVIHGDIFLDASAATVNDTNFPPDGGIPDGVKHGLLFNGGANVSLPSLATGAAPGDQTLAFASAHGLAWGDTIVGRNTTAGSYQGERSYYYDGEFAKVAAVLSATEIMLDRRLRSTLPSGAGSVLFKRPGASVRLAGKLRYLAPDALHTAVRFRRLDDSNIDGLVAMGGASAAFALDKCFGVTGRGLAALHKGVAADTDYGLLVSNSSGIDLSGKWRGRRHAYSPGGDDADDSVPCRDLVVGGEFANDSASGVPAIGIHGNCEDWRVWGISHGGIIVAGDRGTVDLEIYNLSASDLYSIHFAELKGLNFVLNGRVYNDGDPNAGGAGRGVINLGGGEASASTYTTRGGIIQLNVEMKAPNATRPIVMRNRGATPAEAIGIDLRGFKLLDAAASPVSVFNAVSGDAWDLMIFGGNEWPTDHSFSGVNSATKVRGWAGQATASVNTSTSASKVTTAVTFNPDPPKAPVVRVWPASESVHGGKVSIAHAESVTFAGFTAALRSTDQANWLSAAAVTLQIRHTLDEW